MYDDAGRAVDGDERGVRTGEEAMETAHAASFTLRTRGITGRPALVLDRPGGVPQGNGTCTHDPGPDVGEIRYGVPAGILAREAR